MAKQTNIPEDVVEGSYQHSDDPNHKYRALKLLNPTTHQSGDYTCEISSYFDEKRLRITLIVYVLPDEMTLSVEELPDGNISIVCISQPTYPEPFVKLYVEVYGEREAIQADRETVYDNNAYNTTLSVELPPEKLAPYGDVNIVCKMTIPNSNISLEESLHLGPEVEEEVVILADASTHKAVAVPGLSTAFTPHPLLPLLAVVWVWCLRSSSGKSF
ncbi:Immunoglobulin-like domain [Trinorchestia longiramus]|nr:Immunoglobulin-like domain [Trinorchestia longiramus]